jgi:hypothetical protein
MKKLNFIYCRVFFTGTMSRDFRSSFCSREATYLSTFQFHKWKNLVNIQLCFIYREEILAPLFFSSVSLRPL